VTEGPAAEANPRVTVIPANPHRQVWRLAGPIILSNLSVPLLGAVDTAVMGHLPDPAYLGGVAVGQVLFSYIYWGFGFLRMGTTGLIAQALGAGDADEVRAALARALVLAALLAGGVLLLQLPIVRGGLALFEASPDVESLAHAYYGIRIWGAPAALANYVALGWLLGMQRAGRALVLVAAMNALNIVLDLWFVVGLGWGIEGVAAATLISEWSAFGLGLWLMAGPLRRAGGRWDRARIRDPGRIAGLLRVNRDIFIRTLCLISAFAWFTAKGAEMGDITLAANAVLINFQTFMAYGLDGFAHAAEALVGGAVGARDRAAFRRAVQASSVWALGLALIFAASYALLGKAIIAALTGIPEVRAVAAAYLPWAVASPLVSVWSFQLDGIYIGATWTREMRNGMAVSIFVFLAATWLLLPVMGNDGLWLALLIFMAARGLTLGLWYPRLERAIALTPPG